LLPESRSSKSTFLIFMHQRPSASQLRRAESGYILVAAIFLLFLFTIGLSVAVPSITRQIQLDRERETLERGKQYQRAIQLYYRKFHAYPPTIDALVDTNNIRFLRKRYIDPTTRKDDWRPILFGQNKAPTAMGFFGQPITGIGSTGAIGPGASAPADADSLLNSGTGSSAGSGLFPSSPNSGNSAAAGFGRSATPVQSSPSNLLSTSNAQTFGGAGIIGVSPASGGASITAFKKKTRYDEWEFTYDPMTDVALLRNNAAVNQPSVGSLVGNGSGPNGTGPIAAPNPPQGTDNRPNQ
jgi:type II secretory pathway pseudopilin PulG